MNPKNDEKVENAIILCNDCNCKIELQGDIVNVNGEVLCRDCYESNYNVCYNCNKVFYNNELHYQDDEYYCDECFNEKFIECYGCNEIILRDDVYIFAENYYCETCYQDNFDVCESCGEAFCNEDLYYHENSDSSYCESCTPREPDIDGLNNYEYRPHLIYYRGINESKNTGKKYHLYFGIELEVESNGEYIESAIDNLPEFVYAKEDSSLKDGFEIVSHPCTYQWLKENPKKWNGILDLRKSGFCSYNTNTCGIHIHLSKNYFGTWHLYKFLKLFYENPEFILRISQRSKNNLDQWATLKQEHYGQKDESLIYKAKNKHGNYERHTAINLQNSHTIEVRIFKGTLNPRSFWKNIEFVKAVVDFTLNAALKGVIVEKFMGFILEHKKEYINLYNWMYNKDFYQNSLEE